MLYSYVVYETVLDLSRKDLRGRSLSPEEFNRVARIVNEKIFSYYYSKFEESSENSESMSGFKVLGEAVVVAGGIAALPTSFYHICGMPYYIDTGGVRRRLDLVSTLEHAKRDMDYLTQATLTHPTFRFGIATTTADMTIHVSPATGIGTIYLDYIRTPNMPYLDYYLNDTTFEYTWMPSGGGNVSVPSGSTARNGTTGAAIVVSATVDFEWDNEDLPLICAMFLQEMGVQLPSSELYEGGTLSETKINAQ